MTYKLNKSDRSGVVRIVAIYAAFSSLWIYFSDSILRLLVRDVATITSLSVLKGIAFIALTALLLYRLIIRHIQTAREADERIHELNKALESRNAELDRLLTSTKLLFDKGECLAAGMDDYMSKPIDFKKCIAMINAMVGRGMT